MAVTLWKTKNNVGLCSASKPMKRVTKRKVGLSALESKARDDNITSTPVPAKPCRSRFHSFNRYPDMISAIVFYAAPIVANRT